MESSEFPCENCGKRYKYKYNLNQHKRLECGKAPQFACHLCDYTARWKGNLKSHYVHRHSGQPFPYNDKRRGPQVHICDDCGRRYKYRYNLNQHKRAECGKEPQFSCIYCPFRTKQKSNLKSHYGNRHRDKPFPF
ncbi:hypothetical protein J6590_014830 [Homalodisca vitripennis]|nr:hypothetical protein J6590_014830 [Homalodisca vitripennis]